MSSSVITYFTSQSVLHIKCCSSLISRNILIYHLSSSAAQPTFSEVGVATGSGMVGRGWWEGGGKWDLIYLLQIFSRRGPPWRATSLLALSCHRLCLAVVVIATLFVTGEPDSVVISYLRGIPIETFAHMTANTSSMQFRK